MLRLNAALSSEIKDRRRLRGEKIWKGRVSQPGNLLGQLPKRVPGDLSYIRHLWRDGIKQPDFLRVSRAHSAHIEDSEFSIERNQVGIIPLSR